MGIIKKLLSNKSLPKPDGQVIYEQAFTQNSNFRGFKRFHVSYYGYEPAQRGLEEFRKAKPDLANAVITLKYVTRDTYNFVDVYVDGFFIGDVTLWDKQSEEAKYFKQYFLKGKVEKAYIRIDYENVISTNNRGKREIAQREKIDLFLKTI